MDSLKVIDDFLPRGEFERLRDSIMSSDFSWYFQENVSYDHLKGDDFYFTHIFYLDMKPNSSHFNLIQPLIDRLDAVALIRAKANLYTNMTVPLQNGMHKDYPYPHKGALFSLNTNNGYTVFEDGTKVHSVENRMMFFDPTIDHASAHCTNVKRRVNINFNFM